MSRPLRAGPGAQTPTVRSSSVMRSGRACSARQILRGWRSGGVFVLILAGTLITACAPLGAIDVTPEAGPDLAGAPAVPYEVPPTPTTEPFRLTLPTPGSEPISGWRPPLYPVPWAMSPYDHFYFSRPIAADEVNWPLANYRYGGIFFAPNIVHTGIDIDATEGAPVFAAGSGAVVWTGWGLFTESPENVSDPYGLAVAIRHDFGYKDQQLYTIYAHMSEIKATIGQRVETGDLLGLVGSTGATTGPHLHFEVRFPDNSFQHTYNPELWLAPPQGWGVLVGRVMDTRGTLLYQLEVAVRSEESGLTRVVKSYGNGGAINRDPYYNENVVLGDLPAGLYKITLHYEDAREPLRQKDHQTWAEIYPGQVTYFTFRGNHGFDLARPPAPTLDFLPAPDSAGTTPTP